MNYDSRFIGFKDFCLETVEDNSRDIHPSSSVTVSVKHPTINIKCFHGEPENWHTFVDLFQLATDKNDTLPDIQKINYLKTWLKVKSQQ